MATLDPTGLSTLSQAEILAAIEADERAEIADTLDLSTSSPLGQLNRIVARAIALQEEALAAVYAAIDPDTAAGESLLRLCALTGTVREAATASRVTVVCDLDAGTYAAGALVAYPAGRPSDRFENAEEVTSVGGATDVVFAAQETGPIQATTDTLTIAAAVAGWNSITSHPDATVGSAIETEAALRLRRNQEVASPGSSSTSGIAADLTRTIPEIVSVYVVENDTDATVASIPPHAIGVVVFGPDSPTAADDDLVAETILASKAAGIGTYGTTTRTVYDSENQPHAISFTRPAEIAITPTLTIATSATDYAGDDAVIAKIVERAAETYVPGLNAAWSQVVAWAMEVAGVLRVSAVNLGAGAFTDVAIAPQQIATVDTADVTITSASATP